MCGRFTSLLSPDLLESIFGVKVAAPPILRYNVAPSQTVPVVRESAEGERNLDDLRWGLVPSWAKDSAIGNKMINARSESVHEKPSFRQAIKYRRCIVPASGFFEWSHSDGSKQPWYVTLKDDAPMGLAGIWESWQSPDGNNLNTFCILTTAANSLMASIHDRMPVIITPDEFGSWLNRRINSPAELFRLYQPFPADCLTAHKVSAFINSPAHESPECIQATD
jgi:putative SOS response-associated peptidase YedK